MDTPENPYAVTQIQLPELTAEESAQVQKVIGLFRAQTALRISCRITDCAVLIGGPVFVIYAICRQDALLALTGAAGMFTGNVVSGALRKLEILVKDSLIENVCSLNVKQKPYVDGRKIKRPIQDDLDDAYRRRYSR